MKWFTKGAIFTSCFNFDLDRSPNKEKMCSRMCIFLPCQKTFPSIVNDNEQGPSEGREWGGGGWVFSGDNIFI